MNQIKFCDRSIALAPGESLLDALLRQGMAVPHGCKSGVCQSCLLQADPQTVPSKAQSGLKPAQKQLGYFLSCQCVPEMPMEIHAVDHEREIKSVKVLEKDWVGVDTLRLRLERPFDYRPGQYLNVWHAHADQDTPNIIRSYSIASVPELENFVELHIKVFARGSFSQWVATTLQPGDNLRVQGPLGECFYTGEDPLQPLLLVGTGTGLAPLYGIARDALQRGHQGAINLTVGATTPGGFYLWNELSALNEGFSQINISLVSQRGEEQARGIFEADLYRYLKTRYPSTKNMRVYLCGAATFVQKMKKQIFLSGTAMGQIYSDAFLPAGASPNIS